MLSSVDSLVLAGANNDGKPHFPQRNVQVNKQKCSLSRLVLTCRKWLTWVLYRYLVSSVNLKAFKEDFLQYCPSHGILTIDTTKLNSKDTAGLFLFLYFCFSFVFVYLFVVVIFDERHIWTATKCFRQNTSHNLKKPKAKQFYVYDIPRPITFILTQMLYIGLMRLVIVVLSASIKMDII